MNKRALSTIGFGLLCAAAAFGQQAPAAAAPKPGPQAARRAAGALLPGIPARVIQSLNLTDAQKEQGRTILQQMRQSAQPLHQQVQEQRQAMAAAIKANDTMKIQQLSSSLGALNGQVLALRSNAMAQFYALLLPDQQARLDQARQRLRNRLQGRGGAGMGGAGMGMQGGARQQLRQGQRQGLGRLAF